MPSSSAVVAERELQVRVAQVAALPGKAARAALIDLFELALTLEARPAIAVAAPVVLISQVQRSGGTLLSQLFDGNPDVLAYPHELKIGFPRKWDWPSLDLAEPPLVWLQRLFSPSLLLMAQTGYVKAASNPHAAAQIYPFGLHLPTFCHVFLRRVAEAERPRQILDAYLAAFFSAWAEAPPSGRERWIVAFCPRVLFEGDNADRFFGDYPDGRSISCIREPLSWYASAAGHTAAFADLDTAVADWKSSTAAARALKRRRPQSVRLLRYETLVTETEVIMEGLADWLGIAATPSLSAPTYAGRPVLPNSSFAVAERGVHAAAADRSGKLTGGQRLAVERATAGALDGLDAELG